MSNITTVRLIGFTCTECGWENVAVNKHTCPDCGCLVTEGAFVGTAEVSKQVADAIRESDL